MQRQNPIGRDYDAQKQGEFERVEEHVTPFAADHAERAQSARQRSLRSIPLACSAKPLDELQSRGVSGCFWGIEHLAVPELGTTTMASTEDHIDFVQEIHRLGKTPLFLMSDRQAQDNQSVTLAEARLGRS
jgi:hypothetical protein